MQHPEDPYILDVSEQEFQDVLDDKVVISDEPRSIFWIHQKVIIRCNSKSINATVKLIGQHKTFIDLYFDVKSVFL